VHVKQELLELAFPLGRAIQQQEQALGRKRIGNRAHIVAGLRQRMHISVKNHYLAFVDRLGN
jgi:hypothetical protein